MKPMSVNNVKLQLIIFRLQLFFIKFVVRK
nr:MAG TPA: hypothetical protein [Caudoviricetes sp.]DAU65254.1 MAG TPA: hypothetical protein [Caudoviricetes sp.]